MTATPVLSLAGLTLLPSVASLASLGWEHIAAGGSGRRTLLGISSRASRPQGGAPVASALTKAPSLSSFSPFSAGGLGWRVRAGFDPGETTAGLCWGIVTQLVSHDVSHSVRW